MTVLQEDQHQINGTLNQVKGVIREKLGEISNDERMRLTGKKDQLVGKIQANYGDQWIARNSNWVLVGLTVAITTSLIALLLPRVRNSKK